MIEIKLGNAQYNFRAMDKKGIAPIRRVRFSEFNEKQKIALEELGVQLGPFQPGEETKVAVSYTHLDVYKRQFQSNAHHIVWMAGSRIRPACNGALYRSFDVFP